MPYPTYTRAEKIADGTIHTVGILSALTATTILIAVMAHHLGTPALAATILYGVTLVLMLTASGVYHMTWSPRLKPLLRRFDHAAIYLKIAGTFTPLAVLIGSGFGYAVLGLVWLLALGGAISKLFFWQSPGWRSTALYLVMGWLGVTLLWPITQTMPTVASAFLIAGGLTYSAGVVLYQWESLKFSMAIWHGFVLAASACYFTGIAFALNASAALF